jgi:hypothetical protein
MLRKFSYLLASIKETSTVYNIPLAIGRDNFHLWNVVIIMDAIPCCVVADGDTKDSVPTSGPTLEHVILELITLNELIDAQAQDPLCLSKLSELDKAKMKRHFAVNYK